MRSPSLSCFALLLFGALFLSACSGETSYAPYDGTPYPNRRQKFEANGRLLGYVANQRSDSVSVIDLDAMTELGRAPVGRDPLEIDGPRSFTIDASAGLAYISLSYYLSVVSAHAENGAEPPSQRPGYVIALDLNDLAQVGERRVEPAAHDLAFSAQARELLVSHFDTFRYNQEDPQAKVASLDFITPASGIRDGSATLQSIPLCRAPSALVFKSDGTRAFVACTGDENGGQIAVVDTTTRSLLTQFPAGPDFTNKPTAVVADPTEQRLVVSNQISRAIVLFSMLDQPAMIASAYFTGLPTIPTWVSATSLVVPTRDGQNGATLLEVTGTTASVVREAVYDLAQCEAPGQVAQSRDGRLFVLCEGNGYTPGAVVRIDPTTLEILARVEVGIYPDRLALRE